MSPSERRLLLFVIAVDAHRPEAVRSGTDARAKEASETGALGTAMEFSWREEAPPGTSFAPGSVMLSAFPSAGLATIVAGHYIVRVLKLPRIGRFESADLALVLSEFPPSPPQANALAKTILDEAERHQARAVICLEGVVPHPEADEAGGRVAARAPSDEQVWVAYSRKDPAFVRGFEAAKARSLEEGVIGGVSGALLVQGLGRSGPAGVLLVSARVADGL